MGTSRYFDLVGRLAVGCAVLVGLASAASGSAEPTEPGLRLAMSRKWSRSFQVEGGILPTTELLPLRDAFAYVEEGRRIICCSTSSGEVLWSRELNTPETFWPRFRITGLADVIVAERVYSSREQVKFWPVYALDRRSGRIRWQQSLSGPPTGKPALSDSRLLLTHGGRVTCLSVEDGSYLWRTTGISGLGAKKDAQNEVLVSATDDVVAAMDQFGVMAAFSVVDGAPLWRVELPPNTTRGATVRDGLIAIGDRIIAANPYHELKAYDAQTGRVLWRRHSWNIGPDVALVAGPNGLVYLQFGAEQIVALRQRDGRSVWWRHGKIQGRTRESVASELLLRKWDDPWLPGGSKAPLTAREMSSMALVDPLTGREKHAWQPDEGFGLHGAVYAGERLLVPWNGEIHGYELEEEPHWPYTRYPSPDEAVLVALRDAQSSFRAQSPPWPVGVMRPKEYLRVLRMGDAVIRPLAAAIEERINDRTEPGSEEDMANGVEVALACAFLQDLWCPDAADRLRRLLPLARSAEIAGPMVEALVVHEELKNRRVLFEFAMKPFGYPISRRAALYSVSRTPRRNPQEALDPPHEEVMAGLRALAADSSQPVGLRAFAEFELLTESPRAAVEYWERVERNARSSEFRRLAPPALAAKEASPGDPPWHSLDTPKPFAVGKDRAGREWGVFNVALLGGSLDFWLAEGSEKRGWSRVAYLTSFSDTRRHFTWNWREFRLRSEGNGLRLSWLKQPFPPIERPPRGVHRFDPAEVFQDSDGDGLTDRLERRIGTNSRHRDTNHNGVTDLDDPNPAGVVRPLSEKEAQLKAALEGLARYVTLLRRPPSGSKPEVDESTFPLQMPGAVEGVLLVPLAPGSRTPVTVWGHRAPVLPRPNNVYRWLAQGQMFQTAEFTSPKIRFDGSMRQVLPYYVPPPDQDPLAPMRFPVDRRPQFTKDFPIEVSPDGQRARVGWHQGWEASSGFAHFDLELRKMAGRWVCVECQYVSPIVGVRGELPAPERRPIHPIFPAF